MKYLLAAEADKIQDMIFRATRLQSIVGGSQLLTDWCADMAKAMGSCGIPDKDIVVADGGAFRVIFSDFDQARQWTEVLAESYYKKFGTTITIVPPIEMPNGSYQVASQIVQRQLRKAKNRPAARATDLHNPYVAQCSVCGVGLAEAIGKGARLCSACAIRQSNDRSSFLQAFIDEVACGDCAEAGLTWTTDIDKLSRHDARSNVAYLAADGNDMGALFGRCNQEQAKYLSAALPDIMRQALAEATRQQIKRIHSDSGEGSHLSPVLPLIIGGDDLFAVLATPYCLDFVRLFAGTYLAKMSQTLREIGFKDVTPSLSCSLVISKGKYPHDFAHERAMALLEQAKAVARMRAAEQGTSLVALGFCADALDKSPRGQYIDTLQPYALADDQQDGLVPLKSLIDARYRLRKVPTSRLAEFHLLYDINALPSDNSGPEWEEWTRQLNFLLDRTGRDTEDHKDIKAALELLGSADPNHGYMRYSYHSRKYGTALPDLLKFWDYAKDLSRPEEDYEDDR